MVTLGPSTNIALLLKAYPQVKDIERISYDGRSSDLRETLASCPSLTRGVDPEAARLPASGVHVAMVGLEGDAARHAEGREHPKSGDSYRCRSIIASTTRRRVSA